MQRSCFSAAAFVLLAACASGADDRPQTFEFVSLEVLAPACGTVACHSSTTREQGYAFDTLADARKALGQLVVAGRPDGSKLYRIITTSNGVMPPDAPLATEDIALIKSWITAGAPGL